MFFVYIIIIIIIIVFYLFIQELMEMICINPILWRLKQ